MGANERGDTKERVRQGRVGQEIGRDGRGFVRKGQFAGEVGRSSHEQDRAVRKGEGDDRQGFGSEERALCGVVGELQKETGTACVGDEGGCRGGAQGLCE